MGMSSIGPANYAASIAGASSADRVVHRDRKKHPEPTDARRADVVDVDTIDAVRQSSNADEEAREDRQEHGLSDRYSPGGEPPRPSIDVEG